MEPLTLPLYLALYLAGALLVLGVIIGWSVNTSKENVNPFLFVGGAIAAAALWPLAAVVVVLLVIFR